MSAIWKFPLLVVNSQQIRMPCDAVVLSVANQDERVTLWARCSPDAELRTRTFRIFGTGHKIDDAGYCLKFVGTVLMQFGLVWHVFEEVGS